MFSFLLTTLCAAALWEYDPSTFEFLKTHIDQKHQERSRLYFVDSCSCYLNFESKDCASCQNRDFGLGFEESLRAAGFWRDPCVFDSSGHCLGISLLFIQYLLSHPPLMGDSCAQILLSFRYNTLNFQETAHRLQVNQPGYYTNVLEKEWVPIDPSSAKKCFSLLVGSEVDEYVFIPKEERSQAAFNRVALYTALQNLREQIVLMGFSEEDGSSPHCLTIYTVPEKILVFDPNEGLYQFVDFETLSYLYEKRLASKKLTFIVSFPLTIRNWTANNSGD